MALCMAHDSGMEESDVSSIFILDPWVLLLFFKIWMPSLQNDLVHGWGLDFALRRCVEVGDAKSILTQLSTNIFYRNGYSAYISNWLHFCKDNLCKPSLHVYWDIHVSIIVFSLNWLLFKQPAHEKIGVVDAQWIVHQVVPSLGNQVS